MSHSGHTLYKQEEHHAPVSAPTLSSSSGGAAHAAQGAKKQAPLLCFTRKKKGIDGSPNPAVTGILLSPRKKKNVPTSRLPIGFLSFSKYLRTTTYLTVVAWGIRGGNQVDVGGARSDDSCPSDQSETLHRDPHGKTQQQQYHRLMMCTLFHLNSRDGVPFLAFPPLLCVTEHQHKSHCISDFQE